MQVENDVNGYDVSAFSGRKNKTLHFKSSNTMKGYWERGYNLMQNSGRETPVVERTPSAATDLF